MKSFLRLKIGFSKKDEHQRGATAVLVAIMIVVLLGFAALAIDIGYLMASKNEAQNVADAVALAGAGELGNQYYISGSIKCNALDEARIKDIAIQTALQNKVVQESFNLANEDIEIGCWNDEGFTRLGEDTCSCLLYPPNVVKVTVNTDSATSGIITFFVKIFGINKMSVTTDAVASLSAKKEWEPGEVQLPLGISWEWFKTKYASGDICGGNITFYPTGTIDGCAGWTSFDSEKTPNTSTLRKILEDLYNDPNSTPGIIAKETQFGFWGGSAPQLIDHDNHMDFKELFDEMKIKDGDGDDTTWTAKAL